MSENEVIPSKLEVDFGAPGMILIRMNSTNVSPLQLLALAGYLEVTAKSQIVREVESRSVQVPTSDKKILTP